MANNSIPEGYDAIIQLLEDAADGAQTHGAATGLVHNGETALRTNLTSLVGTPAGPANVPPAVPGLKALWNTAQANKSSKTAALRTVQSNGRFLARTCIRSLFPVLGEDWNSAWSDAGFTGGSLAIPTNPLPPSSNSAPTMRPTRRARRRTSTASPAPPPPAKPPRRP